MSTYKNVDKIETNENDLQFNIILPRYLTPIKIYDLLVSRPAHS